MLDLSEVRYPINPSSLPLFPPSFPPLPIPFLTCHAPYSSLCPHFLNLERIEEGEGGFRAEGGGIGRRGGGFR